PDRGDRLFVLSFHELRRRKTTKIHEAPVDFARSLTERDRLVVLTLNQQIPADVAGYGRGKGLELIGEVDFASRLHESTQPHQVRSIPLVCWCVTRVQLDRAAKVAFRRGKAPEIRGLRCCAAG